MTQTPHLLHLDSSVLADSSVSRALSRRAADAWLAAHPGGTVTYRDLAVDTPPHLDADAWTARFVPAEQRSPAQTAAYARSEQLIGEVAAADTVVVGVPLYNYGPPSTLKSWIDHLVFPGLSITPDMTEGLLSGPRVVVLAARGGGYGEGTPRFGWDHAAPWLTHIFSAVGLEPEIVAAELTATAVNPALAHLKPLADESLAAAHAAIDDLWAPAPVA